MGSWLPEGVPVLGCASHGQGRRQGAVELCWELASLHAGLLGASCVGIVRQRGVSARPQDPHLFKPSLPQRPGRAKHGAAVVISPLA